MPDDGQARFSFSRVKTSPVSHLVSQCISIPSQFSHRKRLIVFGALPLFLASRYSLFLSSPPLLFRLAVPDDDWNSSTGFEFPWEDVLTQVGREAAWR